MEQIIYTRKQLTDKNAGNYNKSQVRDNSERVQLCSKWQTYFYRRRDLILHRY